VLRAQRCHDHPHPHPHPQPLLHPRRCRLTPPSWRRPRARRRPPPRHAGGRTCGRAREQRKEGGVGTYNDDSWRAQLRLLSCPSRVRSHQRRHRRHHAGRWGFKTNAAIFTTQEEAAAAARARPPAAARRIPQRRRREKE
jgi:hypothetical protein